jgi:hypothetical protein
VQIGCWKQPNGVGVRLRRAMKRSLPSALQLADLELRVVTPPGGLKFFPCIGGIDIVPLHTQRFCNAEQQARVVGRLYEASAECRLSL